VKHMMISNVKGTFNEVYGDIELDPEDLTDASINFTINTNSIDTHMPDRDVHSRSADLFDVENHPNITFTATDIQKTSEDNYDLSGDLTIRGTTQTVKFDLTFEGVAKVPKSGDEAAGFSGSIRINRKEFR